MDKDKEKNFQPVANGSITPKRPGVIRTIVDEVIVKNFNEIKNNFIQDVILPNTIDWLNNVCSNFISDLFNVPYSSRSRTYNRSGSSSYYTSYSSYGSKSRTSSRDRDRRREEDDRNNKAPTYKDISFATRREAEHVLANLQGALEEYKVVNILDLCQFANVESTWADDKYGWMDLEKAGTYRANDGRYYLDLPEPKPIEDDD